MKTCEACGKENIDVAKFCANCGNPFVMGAVEDPDLRLLNTTLRPKGYTVEKALGSGGMATVYLGEQTALGRHVVIKLLNAELSKSADMRERFLREARTGARLKHPNIVEVIDVGSAEGRPYFIMEFVSGGSLADRLDELKKAGQTMDTKEAAVLTAKILNGLHEAHRHGVVHRDIKPDNILLRENGEPVIVDFGIAKVSDATVKTQTGLTMGTVNYMSPEQCRGATDIDGRSDIYSTGIMLFQLLTGEVPYKGETAISIVNKHIHDPFPKMTNFLKSTGKFQPADFTKFKLREAEAIIEKACQKEREKRYADAKEFADTLFALVGEKQVITKGGGLSGKTLAIAAGVLLALTGGFFGVKTFLAPKGNIIIESTPSGASVYEKLTDQLVGTTPFRTTKEQAGLYEYSLKMDGYRSEDTIIRLKDPSKPETVNVALNDLRNLSLETTPAGANITASNDPNGLFSGKTTPLRMELPAGKYELTLKKDGYIDEKLSLTIGKDGEKLTKTVKLYTKEEIAKKKEEDAKKAAETKKSDAGTGGTPTGSGDWSGYMGPMKWNDAKAKCASIGMRLPSIDELKAAYKSGVTKSWQRGGYYLSSTPSGEHYYNMAEDDGFVFTKAPDHYSFVRCRR